MDEQKVLVTGGFEYIGSNTFQALQRPGFIPVIFDNLASGWRDAIEFGPFEQADLVQGSLSLEAAERARLGPSVLFEN